MAEDLLEAVRDCVQNKRQIKEINGKICLNGQTFLKSSETTFPIKWVKGGNKEHKGRKYYNLGEICFFVENRALTHTEFVKKAQEKNIKYVQKPDRKPLLQRLFAKSNRKLRSTAEQQNQKIATAPSHISSKTEMLRHSPAQVDPDSGSIQTDDSIGEGGRQKSYIRTYSRKRCFHEVQPSSRRRSEDQFSEVDPLALDAELTDELALLKNDNINLERSLKSVSSFLQEHLGVTDEQLQAIQESESNTVELSIIASKVKNNIVHASIVNGGDPSSCTSYGNSKLCYKAIKHPVRGWEMIKEDLSSVLLGYDSSKHFEEIEVQYSTSLEKCLARGTFLLKHAFSILISQMREFNKPVKSEEESDLFYKKVVKECLSNAVDCFRDIFNSLISSENIDEHSVEVERWVDVIRAELGKLFNSLAMTLQSLRDIPATQQKAPTSLFHFPEPTFSLALNPAKVTHSVVLDMYVHIGLAELRRILNLFLGDAGQLLNVNLTSDALNGVANNNYESTDVLKIDPDRLHNLGLPHQDPFQSTSEPTDHSTMTQNSSPSQYQTMENLGSIDTQIQSNSDTSSSSCVLDEIIFHKNGAPGSLLNSRRSSQARRASESDFCQYNQFKVSLGNTLVSSFKKQIQEKIQASNLPSDSNSH